jgi:hypothetical protein
MKNQLFRLGACLALFLSVSCEKQEQADVVSRDYFITDDLSFLNEGVSGKGGAGWPANGCKEFDVKVKFAGVEIKTTVQHCCVNYACNLMPVNHIVNFFLGDKSGKNPTEVEIISSGIITFNQYDIRIHPGMYQLDGMSKGLKDLQYEVWVTRP